MWVQGRRERWRSWWSIIRLLPVAGRVAVAAMVLNLVIGVLSLGFVIGTSVAIGRVAGTGGASGAGSYSRWGWRWSRCCCSPSSRRSRPRSPS